MRKFETYEEYEAACEKCGEIAHQLTLKEFCKALYNCLNSEYGRQNEYCTQCPFCDCCIMSWSPDGMLYDILSSWRTKPEFTEQEAIDKALKYDKISKIINGGK
jgi:hypothetical protein